MNRLTLEFHIAITLDKTGFSEREVEVLINSLSYQLPHPINS